MAGSKGIVSVSEQLEKLLVKNKKSNLFGRSYGLQEAKKEKEATDNHQMEKQNDKYALRNVNYIV